MSVSRKQQLQTDIKVVAHRQRRVTLASAHNELPRAAYVITLLLNSVTAHSISILFSRVSLSPSRLIPPSFCFKD
jgi:hypothetical protein